MLLGLSWSFGAPVTPVRADDCARAREFYVKGTKVVDFEKRAQLFQQAVKLCPSFAEAHANLGDAFENLAKLNTRDVDMFNKSLDRAVAEYQAALKLKPNLFAAHLGLGDTYRVMGMYDQAENAYQAALRLKPGHSNASTGLEKIRLIKAQEKEGFRGADEILKHFKTSSKDKGVGGLMGFAGRTAVKDRLRFDNILFDTMSAKLIRVEAIDQLKEIGTALRTPELSACNFVIEGHTDNRGGHEMNMELSQRRAESVRSHLISEYGIDPSRVAARGFGYERPRSPNDSPENMLKNRRVELLFVNRSDR